MKTNWSKPSPTGLTPYQRSYMDQVAEGDLPALLEKNIQDTLALLKKIPAGKLTYRYAAGKWSIPQIVQHMSDCERIFAYRILAIARGDKTPLPGFEENDYAKECGADERKFEEVIQEFVSVRNSTLTLLKGLPANSVDRKGTSNNLPVSAKTLAYMIAGHEVHHVKVIKEKYLVK